MADARPAKQAIRDEWMEVLDEYAPVAPQGETLYATLCGGAGTDVRLLIERGHVAVEENGAIAVTKFPRVIAVEKDPIEAGLLKNAIPGLQVIASSVEDILIAQNEIRYPVGLHLEVPRAHVLNLDFNGNLEFRVDKGKGLVCTTIDLVRKAAMAHAAPPLRQPWALFLTVRGTADWPESVDGHIASALRVARQTSPGFAQSTLQIEDEFLSGFDESLGPPLSSLAATTQQRVIIAYVAYRVLQVASAIGWRATCKRARFYGGESGQGTAPMCTWMFDFHWSNDAHSGNPSVLETTLETALSAAAYVDANGVLRGFDESA